MAVGDWVPCRGYGFSTIISAVNPQADIVLVRHGQELDPADNPSAIVEMPDHILTMRVVGQMQIIADDANAVPQTMCMRIRTALYDDATDQIAVYANDLFAEDGANEPFLWQRYVDLFPDQRLLDVVNDPWWSAIDVRVKRLLDRQTALVLTVQTSTTGRLYMGQY